MLTGTQCSAFKQPTHSAINILSDSSYEDYKENVTKFEPGTQIEITCIDEAHLAGDNIVTCLENGEYATLLYHKTCRTSSSLIQEGRKNNCSHMPLGYSDHASTGKKRTSN